MTVVEACIGRKKLNSPNDSSKLNSEVLSLIKEGISQNTTGTVFVPKVFLSSQLTDSILGSLLYSVFGVKATKKILGHTVSLDLCCNYCLRNNIL